MNARSGLTGGYVKTGIVVYQKEFMAGELRGKVTSIRLRCIKSGVSVIASMHGVDVGDKFVGLFDYLVRLSSNPVGKILEKRVLC